MDTGAGQHLCPADSLSREILEEVKPCDDIRLSTANGVINARGQVELSFLGASGKFLLLDKTPPVISIGRLVEDHSFAFEWRKGRARLTTPSGREIACTVMGYVPTLAARPTLPTASAASAVPVALAETRGVVTPAAMAADPDVVEGGGTAPAAQSTGACDAAMACAGTDRVGAAGEMTRPALTSAGASSQPHGDGSNELGSPVVAGSLGDGSNEPGSPQEDDGGPAPVRAACGAGGHRDGPAPARAASDSARGLSSDSPLASNQAEGHPVHALPGGPDEDAEPPQADGEPAGALDAEPPQADGEPGGEPDAAADEAPAPGREEVLRAEAGSLAHRLTHLPKNPFCDICAEGKFKAKPARRRNPVIDDAPSEWGDVLLGDAFNLKELSIGVEGERYGLVLKDVGTGLSDCFPLRKKSRALVVCAIREFGGTTQWVKFASDNGPELIAAAKFEKMQHCTSTPWRPTSNSLIEREMQLVGDGTRTLLAQAGLTPQWWTYASRAFCLAHNVKADADGASPWVKRHGKAFEGKLVPFGAEVIFRLPPPYRSKGKFGPHGAHGLFLGWYLQPGGTFHGDYLCAAVDDLFDSPDQRCRVHRVKEVQLLAEGVSFPLREAIREDRQDRIRARVERGDQIEAMEPIADQYGDYGVPQPLQAIEDIAAEGSDLDDEDNDDDDDVDNVDNDDNDNDDGNGARASSSTAPPPPRAKRIFIPKVRPTPAPLPKMPTITDDMKIEFDKVNPKRPGTQSYDLYEKYKDADTVEAALKLGASRGHIRYDVKKRFARVMAMMSVMVMCAATAATVRSPLVEGWCSPQSPLGEFGEIHGRTVHRFTADDDLSKESTIQCALRLARNSPGSHLHCSLPCTPWTSWQRLNLRKGGPATRARIERMRAASLQYVKTFTRLARCTLSRGGSVTFEWPRHCDGWRQPEVVEMVRVLNLHPVDIDGCSVGVVNGENVPIYKPWRIMCSSRAVSAALEHHRCDGGHRHAKCEGRDTEKTAYYPTELCRSIHRGLDAHEDLQRATMALPALHLDSGDAVPAYTAGMYADHPDADHQVCLGPQVDACHRPRHHYHRYGVWSGLVTRIVPANSQEFRTEACVEALRKERTTLESAGVWDLAAVREWRDVRASPGEHMCGRIFAIMGEKHAERKSAPADRVYKARIVFAGNNIQTASGTAPHELYTEISQTPAAMNTVRAALAIAALRGFVPKVRDATQAYIQAVIDKAGRPRTWVRLPKAWWPAHWFDGQGVPLYYDPVVVLVRALYGHPESGALWDRHLRAILVKLQWRRVESHPGLYVHSVTMAILVVYVDDLLLAAPPAEEARLWAEIEAHVGFGGDPEAISKFLGGHHKVLIDRSGVTSASCQMAEFISDAVQCYMDEIGVQRLPAVRSPYLDEDFVPKGQDDPGTMAKTASSHLMKLLFAARLCRPDLLVAITRLAAKVSCWQRCHDRHLHRMFQYLAHSADMELCGTLSVGDLDSCVLVMSVDADLASDMDTAKSTSGMFLELRSADGARCWPLSWRSKRQGSTASSTCEAEYIALSTCLKAEALPMLDLLREALGRDVHLDTREDNTQCIAAVKNGYSAALRHLPRTERISLSVCHEIYIEDGERHSLNYEETAVHKGDIFTKRLPPIGFEQAIVRLGLRPM